VGGVVSSANSSAASVAGESSNQMNKKHSPINKLLNTRNAIIAVIIMLILLLTLQTPVCCDGVVTTELMLPAAVAQPERPAQIPLAPVIKAAPAKPAVATVKPAEVKTIKDEPVATANETEPVIELAAIAPASGPAPVAAVAEEEIRHDAAATLATVVESGFVKIAYSGEVVDDNETRWECVEDKGNNLVWEVKKNDGGIRDRDYSYSWFSEINGKKIGVSDGGRCKGGVSCDTASYARAMNEQKLCGYSDWRLPTREELETLVEYTDNPKQAAINETYFPEAVPSWYWTASENPQREGYAWYVLFRNGVALNDLKERPKHIRLVRGDIQQ
jgi:hypothetical protein